MNDRPNSLYARTGLIAVLAVCTVFSIAASSNAGNQIARTSSVTVCAAASGENEPANCHCCQPTFWIVSTRSCPQRRGWKACPPRCCFDEFLYTQGKCLRQMQPGAFQQWLNPKAPICIVVHGSYTSFEDLLEESCALYRWLYAGGGGRPLNVVLFTWPSDDSPTGFFPADINLLGKRSGFNGFYLAQFIRRIPQGRRVSLLGHSYGSRTVSAFLHLQSGGKVQGIPLCAANPCLHRYRAVFLAAAIDHHWLNPGKRYGRALCAVEGLVNVRNRKDLALAFYPLRAPFSHRALGRTGFHKSDLRALGARTAHLAEVDVTELLGRHHLWVYYFERTEIAVAVSPYIYFTDDEQRQMNPPPPQQTNNVRRPVTRETYSVIRRVSVQLPVRPAR